MIVGVLELTLAIPAHTLKEKRSVVKRVIHRTRHKFPVAISEVDALDHAASAVIGVACVTNEGVFAERMLHRVEDFVEELGLAEVVDRFTRLEYY